MKTKYVHFGLQQIFDYLLLWVKYDIDTTLHQIVPNIMFLTLFNGRIRHIKYHDFLKVLRKVLHQIEEGMIMYGRTEGASESFTFLDI